MAKAYVHAKSSARKWGGRPEDYLAIHEKMDESKSAFADVRHRVLYHHSLGPQMMQDVFGVTIVNSEGKEVVVKDVAEQHILEDMGYIPAFSEYCDAMRIKPFMSGIRKAKFKLVD